MNIIIVGLGYVGLTYAIHMTSRGFKVIGIETNTKTRSTIKNKKLPFFEKGLEKALKFSIEENLLKVYSPSSEKFQKILKKTEKPNVFIITVGTPVKNKILDFKSINSVFKNLNYWIKPNDGIVIRSTVEIGLTRKLCEKFTDVNYCFAPERTIEGKAISELKELPQILGANSKESSSFFEVFFRNFHSEVINVKNTETAEIIKLTTNTYRDVIFGFSNEIAKICYENNVNSKEVIDSCNYNYSRSNIAYAGPVSGPCLTKDSYILKSKNADKNSIILSARRFNEDFTIEIIDTIIKKNKIKKACILGLAFKGKPQTSDVRDSLAGPISNFLKTNEIVVTGYDPIVFDKGFNDLKIMRINKLGEVFKDNELVIIHNNNPEFSNILLSKYEEKVNTNCIILDLWSIIPYYESDKIKLISL